VRQVQGIDQYEAGLVAVPQIGAEPFERCRDAIQEAQVFVHGERARVLGRRQGTVGMRLRKMNERPDSPRVGRIDVTANQRIHESRLPDARDAFD
jgi:hypothetical protein